jgi:hypothetical protein
MATGVLSILSMKIASGKNKNTLATCVIEKHK